MRPPSTIEHIPLQIRAAQHRQPGSATVTHMGSLETRTPHAWSWWRRKHRAHRQTAEKSVFTRYEQLGEGSVGTESRQQILLHWNNSTIVVFAVGKNSI